MARHRFHGPGPAREVSPMHAHRRSPISGHVRLRDGKRGSTWYAKFRGPVRQPDGRIATRQAEEKIGPAWTGTGRPPAGHFTRRTAEEWLDAKLTDLRRGVGIRSEDDGTTFADVAEKWYRRGCDERDWKPSTRRDYRSALDRHLLPTFGERPIGDLDRATVEAWRSGLLAGGLGRRQAVKLTAILHGIYKRAVRAHGVTLNPIADVEPLRLRYTPEDYSFYSPEEVAALERAAESEQDAAIYRTAAYAGMRMGEVLALRVRDVDFDAESIRVMGSIDTIEGVGTPKSGKGRTIPMVGDLATTLARIFQRDRFTGPDDFVFPNEVGRYLDGSALRRRYKAAQTRAGLRPLRFHDLRHTFGSLAIREVGGFDVQSYMGHADSRTTARYLHYRRRSGEAEKLAAAFRVEPVAPESIETAREGA